jgi:hypothetical protein
MIGQRHGKQFEDMVKALLYSGAADKARKSVAKFDIEANFDKEFNLDTSVKASKNCSNISLADARHFWQINTKFRLLVGCWKQITPEIKQFYEIHEFIITPAIMQELRGNVTLQQITDFHETIKTFGIGKHEEARIYAKQQKKILQPQSLIILNPKIDSKSQRRLQCSLNMEILQNICREYAAIHHVYNEIMGSLVLPMNIKSSPRKFSLKHD